MKIKIDWEIVSSLVIVVMGILWFIACIVLALQLNSIKIG